MTEKQLQKRKQYLLPKTNIIKLIQINNKRIIHT